MVIDDQKSMRSIIRQLLAQHRFQTISEAENGVEALRLLSQMEGYDEAPDVIICDLYMDQMDGLEFVNKLRRKRNLTPVLILTGESDRFVHDVSRQAGATRVLTKPISGTDLAREVRSAIGFTHTFNAKSLA